jgi:hypothetical protein
LNESGGNPQTINNWKYVYVKVCRALTNVKTYSVLGMHISLDSEGLEFYAL